LIGHSAAYRDLWHERQLNLIDTRLQERGWQR